MTLSHDLQQDKQSPQINGGGKATRRLEGVKQLESAHLPTVFGEFRATVYEDSADQREHMVLCMGDIAGEPPLVRIHSECLTGDVLGSVRCDCREQLITSLKRISEEGRGVLVYLRQEGRGIGLGNKIHAYSLQDQGLDTVDANLHLGFPADSRSFAVAAEILRSLGVTRVRLLTNNPQKIADLEEGQIEVVERVFQQIVPRPENQRYIQAKVDKLGHMFDDIVIRKQETESVDPDQKVE
ncbi:MAG: GTP cyclohydrolase II [Planctomycetales bacterium]|nr:GTP cyclohydrolase II [Planctomycetales bacterium]